MFASTYPAGGGTAFDISVGGKTRLRMTDNLPTRQTFTRIANALASG